MTDLGGGLGLDYNALRLEIGRDDWQQIGSDLASDVGQWLDELAIEVEHVGSTSVPGLLAKPIIDLAIGVDSLEALEALQNRFADRGWIYRGDAGDDGGHLFVLETRPWFRVAHAHVVLHEDWQWRRYLRFRDHLRSSADARAAYTQAKTTLVRQLPADGSRATYTERKAAIVSSLLDDAGWTPPA